ncbi:RNA methyltransferase tRNA(m5U54)methyltransferase [Pseudogymnoascus australis]
MSSSETNSLAKDIGATPAVGQHIHHDGKDYSTIKEGLAYILVPGNGPLVPQTNPTGDNQSQSVFYNPIQQFNRDLSVLAIKAYGEDAVAKKEAETEKRRKAANAKSKKRKRVDETVNKDGAGGAAARAETTSDNGETVTLATNKASEQTAMEIDGPAMEGLQHAGIEAETEASLDRTVEQNGTDKSKQQEQFTILDALSATGLRALRYAQEIPFTTSVTANDLLPEATRAINLNVLHNKLTSQINPVTGNAITHMYNFASEIPLDSHRYKPSKKYDVIDLDPYGTAVPFLDAAVQAVRDDGGLLCVTCTDAGVWASNGYPEKCYSLYGGLPLKGMHSHEGGLRLILHAIASSAARYGLAIEPLLSLSIDFYARVFVKIHKSPADVKFLAGKTMMVYNCDQGCGSWETQLLAKNQLRPNKSGKGTYWKHIFAQAPTTGRDCEHCGWHRHLAGPMWAGPLHDGKFIQRILDDLPKVDKETYQTTTRLEGMLSMALEETLAPPPRTDDLVPPPVPKGRADPSVVDPFPFYFIPSVLSKVIHCITPDENAMRGALRHAGYRVTRSHTKAGTIKTDAPWSIIWEVMREWARQKAPVREGAVREGTPGWKVMGFDKKQAENEEAGKGDGEGNERLKIVFDESLGRETDKKKLVRYQVNPRENWGPMNRARGPLIRWIPVVLTFSFTGKELRNNQISSFVELLERLDIKVLVEYVHQSTTHVVAKKRNTSKGLQALINGKHIVDHSFIDAIVNVTTADPGAESALESDFDSNWPKELDHLPPKGPEQTDRPSSSYLPDPTRLTIFEGYTFVFYEQSQFDNLIAPITNGKGKALLHQANPASTTAEEFVRYVKNVAGEKGVGEFEDGSTGTGVVVVRYQPLKGPTLPFYSDFGQQISLQLDHRLIEQSEFLDAILNNDASVLRRPLEVESSAVPASLTTDEPRRVITSALEEKAEYKAAAVLARGSGFSRSSEEKLPLSTGTVEPPARREGRSRRAVTSRFTGFDDEFNGDSTPSETIVSASSSRLQDSSAMDYQKSTTTVVEQAAVPEEPRVRTKRPLPQVQESDNENIMDQLAPAAAKLKRLRLANGEPTNPPDQPLATVEAKAPSAEPKEAVKKPRKVKKEADAPEFTYLQRQGEPPLTDSQRDASGAGAEDVDAPEVRNLSSIKEMGVRRPDAAIQARDEARSDRWDERWNGRVDFKKFRRKGGDRLPAAQKVIVSLEVAKQKDFGIGDSYWLKNDKASQLRKKDKSQRTSQNESPIQSQTLATRSDVEESNMDSSNPGGSLSNSMRDTGQPEGRHKSASTGRSASNKRPSSEALMNPPPVKKVKRPFQKEDSDDSDDGLGFRFQKRK